jgi:hypothetical protein
VLIDHRLSEAAELDFGLDLLAQHLEHGALGVGQLTRAAVDHAERAQSRSVGGQQRLTSVEANGRCASDKRIASKAFVLGGVGNLEATLKLCLSDGVPAKRHGARSLIGIQANA